MTRRLFLTLKAVTLGALLSFSFNATAQTENPQVLLETSKGNITLELNANKAPKSVANFLGYVNSGYYDGLIFHRVINGFMIQGGGLDGSMKKKPSKAPIINEADNGLSNDRGTIAMARTGDPHSATSQFFINHKDNNFLNHTGKNSRGWGYAVFGKVTQGMDVVDAIAKVSTTRVNGRGDVPAKPIIIIKASQIK
ncbi:peptidylprolyl isomerase [Thiomicrorhabdus sp. 6S2-11]|uniref:Peptidyl-prolyl cis-trans isomerase n=1 Tax=Thiomicrorhabdus marina TaxID=2818442 RepID=A0ABS3Q119_9GAMM|nr:peptidylprolyl isomerase [Thiomicrorhabdus marina]MBO1926007.1 peptidylprolyl isomerase [Thiomicrorhabdus marina]